MVEYACIGGNFLMTVALTFTVNLIGECLNNIERNAATWQHVV